MPVASNLRRLNAQLLLLDLVFHLGLALLERHLALAQRNGEGMSVGLVGWDQLVDKDLRKNGQEFAGKYVAHSSTLNHFPPLRWASVA